MTTISSHETQSGVRYRVRYRKPDGSQTDKRGFKRKRDAEQWAAEHVTTAKAQGSFIDPQDAKITVSEMWAKLMDLGRAFAGIVCAVGGAGRTPIPEAASGIAHETPDCCRAARQTWRVRATAGWFGFMPDAPPFISRQIPNRWNLADSWPLSSVRRRFGQTNFGVGFGVGSE